MVMDSISAASATTGDNAVVLPGGSYYASVGHVIARHLDTCNTLFIDGHVKAMKETELLKTVPNSGRKVFSQSNSNTGDGAGFWFTTTPTQIFHYFQTDASSDHF
jgi:prepilin-type processing-associated H-X9-DG protein